MYNDCLQNKNSQLKYLRHSPRSILRCIKMKLNARTVLVWHEKSYFNIFTIWYNLINFPVNGIRDLVSPNSV